MSLNSLNNVLAPPAYRESDFAHLTAKQLGKLHGCFDSYKCPDAAVEVMRLRYIEGKNKEQAKVFKIFILGLKHKKMKGQILETGRIEETAHGKGSQIAYAKETITVTTKSSDVTVIKNSVVPDPTVAVRPRAGVVIAFLSRTLAVKGAELVVDISSNAHFAQAFADPRTTISLTGMAEFGIMAQGLIVQDPYWKALTLNERLTLTSNKMVAFLSRFVNLCSWKVYITLHTLIVTKALRVYSSYYKGGDKKMKLGHIVKFQKKPVVDLNTYLSSGTTGKVPEEWGLTGESLEGAKKALKFLGIVALYKGGARMFQKGATLVNPKLLDVTTAIGDGNNMRGGHKTSYGILSSCTGFSGVPTKLTKASFFFYSLACYAVYICDKVDIHLPSIGYLVTMISTLQNGKAYILPETCTDDELRKKVWLIVDHADMPTDLNLRMWCHTHSRADSFHVLSAKRSAPTFPQNVTPQVVEDAQKVHLSAMEDYTHYAAIAQVFADHPWQEGLAVYQYGRPGSFLSVVSTNHDLMLLGTSSRRTSPEFVSMTKYDSKQALFEAIIKDNFYKNAYFLSPTSHYSPICNVPIVTAKGLVWSDAEVQAGDVYDYDYGWDNKGSDDEEEDREEGDEQDLQDDSDDGQYADANGEFEDDDDDEDEGSGEEVKDEPMKKRPLPPAEESDSSSDEKEEENEDEDEQEDEEEEEQEAEIVDVRMPVKARVVSSTGQLSSVVVAPPKKEKTSEKKFSAIGYPKKGQAQKDREYAAAKNEARKKKAVKKPSSAGAFDDGNY